MLYLLEGYKTVILIEYSNGCPQSKETVRDSKVLGFGFLVKEIKCRMAEERGV
jgi:hypothetical protein